MRDVVLRNSDLAYDLEYAIEHHQVFAYYQPVVDLAAGTILEAEALARWVHPRLGRISPSDFIPVAEQDQLIVPLGLQVLKLACQQARAWHLQFPHHPQLVVNVNLSVKQLQQPTLVEDVRRTLRESRLDPACLQLEITESVLMQERNASLRTLRALRDLGVAIAIDDFGTGYSALNYLRWLPANLLKLDRSFVRGLGKNPHDEVIVRHVIAMAKELGLTVTAEGVETEEQAACLFALGCDRGQGYYFARPLPPAEMGRFLQRERWSDVAPSPLGGGISSTQEPRQQAHHTILIVEDNYHITTTLKDVRQYRSRVKHQPRASAEPDIVSVHISD
jgi:EAL domain-containing protein (putative c-di-GMP-specific phosphodiesterase class I)